MELPVPGEPLRDALDRYASVGLNVVSSRRVLPRTMAVKTVPAAGLTVLEQVQQLLAPHGLEVMMTDAGNGYVRARPVTTGAKPGKKHATATDSLGIEEIVVSASYRLRRAQSQSHAIAHEDLQTVPSLGRDTLRGLSGLPGVASSGISARSRFRGGSDDEVLYRLDGVTLLEPFHLSSAQSLFTAINPHLVDRADVFLSGFPVSAGTRMSGVVDLSLVEAADSFSGTLDLNPIAASTYAQGQAGQWDWLVSGRHSLVHKALAQVDTDYGEPRFNDELVRLAWHGERDAVRWGALRSEDQLRVRNPRAGETGSGGQRNLSLWLGWERDWRGGWRSDSLLQWSAIDAARQGQLQRPEFAVGTLDDQRDVSSLTLSNNWSKTSAHNVDVAAGWSLAWERGRYRSLANATFGPLAASIQSASGLDRNLAFTRKGISGTGYLSADWHVGPRLTMGAGVRFDGQDIDPVHVSELSVRGRITYDSSIAHRWFLDVGRYTQQQQLYELQTDDGKAELDRPSHSDQINVGWIWQPIDQLTVRAEGFWRRIDSPWSKFDNLYNRWVLLPELQGDRYLFEPSRARLRGAEISAHGVLFERLSWSLSYAFTDAQDRVAGHWLDRPWQQRHAGKAGLRWQSERWEVELRAVVRNGWPVTDQVSDAQALPASAFNQQLPNYRTIDLHIGRRFNVAPGELELYLDVSNLGNYRNAGGRIYSLTEPNRNDTLLPLVPVLGVSWHW
ncbi:MAG: TonB-dependent receptor plug domain-containing protein [Pseudomonadales bacterium]